MISSVELALERLKSNSTPNSRKDRYKLALCIEGGGMRGVVTGGMVAALERMGMRQVFDEIYGVSAGAFAGAFFLCGRASFGTTVYYEDVNSKDFFDPLRLLQFKAPVSIEFLTNEVLKHRKPLDFDAIKSSGVILCIVATDVKSGAAILFDHFSDLDDLRLKLTATAKMPILSGPPVVIDGEQYLDGGLSAQFPHHLAAKRGATHVLSLVPRCSSWSITKKSYSEIILSMFVRQKGLGRVLHDRRSNIERDLTFLIENCGKTIDGTRYDSIFLSEGSARVDRLERRQEKLLEGMLSGARAVYDAFGQNDVYSFVSFDTVQV